MNVNWLEIIDNLPADGSVVSASFDRWDLSNPEYLKIYNQWKSANFNMSAVGWINYYPSAHFDASLTQSIADHLGLGIHRSWISKINPGYIAPVHWDVDDNESKYLEHGKIIRKTIIMHKFDLGQLLIINSQHYYNVDSNDVIDWNSHRDLHIGVNASLSPNYLFHIVGYNK
jgi:hypothetical protein